MSDYISRRDAIDAWWHDEVFFGNQRDDMTKEQWLDYITDVIGSLPSADRPTTDCTEFMEWIKAEVLDENNWELNAVAYGEIICRKLKKLGWIDVEDGFYVDTRPTGEWVYQESENIEKIYLCSNCKNYEAWGETEKTPYCPNCGAKMKGGEA